MWILAIYSLPMVQYYTREGGSKKKYWILMRCLQTSSINFKIGFYWPNWAELEVGGENKIFYFFNRWCSYLGFVELSLLK